jgi:DNA-directed RNA polymerase specialized sigma24 family protein
MDRAERLRARLDDAVASLSMSRRGKRAMAALSATYLQPLGTQEEVAEALDLPFSTYRRHLHEGIALLAELLRQT